MRHFLLFACLFILMPRPALAYIDPGTGSMIFQAVAAGVVGGLFTIKMFWARVKQKIREWTGKKNAPPSDKG